MSLVTVEPQRFENQKGIIDPDILAQKEFTIVGAGAIGSFLVPTLAKMGARKIIVYDPDTIEEHNVANQFYSECEVGERKVDALSRACKFQSGVAIDGRFAKWAPGDWASEFMICCVDSMASRKDIYAYSRDHVNTKYLVDGRMGAQFMRVYCVNLKSKGHREFYERTLYSDSQAVQDRCTEKSIMDTGLIVAGHMLTLLRQAISGSRRPINEDYCCITHTHVTTHVEE